MSNKLYRLFTILSVICVITASVVYTGITLKADSAAFQYSPTTFSRGSVVTLTLEPAFEVAPGDTATSFIITFNETASYDDYIADDPNTFEVTIPSTVNYFTYPVVITYLGDSTSSVVSGVLTAEQPVLSIQPTEISEGDSITLVAHNLVPMQPYVLCFAPDLPVIQGITAGEYKYYTFNSPNGELSTAIPITFIYGNQAVGILLSNTLETVNGGSISVAPHVQTITTELTTVINETETITNAYTTYVTVTHAATPTTTTATRTVTAPTRTVTSTPTTVTATPTTVTASPTTLTQTESETVTSVTTHRVTDTITLPALTIAGPITSVFNTITNETTVTKNQTQTITSTVTETPKKKDGTVTVVWAVIIAAGSLITGIVLMTLIVRSRMRY